MENQEMRLKIAIGTENVEMLKRYVEKGTKTGGFLTSILANDLCMAVQRADIAI